MLQRWIFRLASYEIPKWTLVYFIATLVWSWLCWLPIIMAARDHIMPSPLVLILALIGDFGPSSVAILMTLYLSGGSGISNLFGRVIRWRVNLAWYIFAIFWFGAILFGAIVLCVFLSGQLSTNFGAYLSPVSMVAIFLAQLPTSPVAEELGWRGYALPALQQRHSALSSSIVIGIIWGVWHMPLAAMPGSIQGDVPTALYLTQIVALSMLFTWLYNITGGSLLLSILFHASINAWLLILPVLPIAGGSFCTLVISTALTLVCGISAVIFVDYRPMNGTYDEISR